MVAAAQSVEFFPDPLVKFANPITNWCTRAENLNAKRMNMLNVTKNPSLKRSPKNPSLKSPRHVPLRKNPVVANRLNADGWLEKDVVNPNVDRKLIFKLEIQFKNN
jgi:hypothetical protein